ncbi:MAG: DUF308 domain-containing protein [Micromonosporaceae bacterium]|nr:DUF308 domain-containing protein [Micromonosporaceae bacterium]
MATAGRRRGRRNNGLDATDWRAIEDLDPRVSEDVLDVLATRGIAAFVQPSMDVDPVTRSATVPSRPTDRLYVDRGRVAAARDLLHRLLSAGPGPLAGDAGDPAELATLPDPDPDPERDSGPRPAEPTGARNDVDATFAGIVAGFNQPVDPTAALWPAAENLSGQPTPQPGQRPDTRWSSTGQPEVEPPEPALPDGEVAEPPRHPAGPVDARSLTEPSLLDALDTFGADLPDEPPERFVPPPPPPLPRLSRQTVLGALAILVGLVLLLGRPDLPLDRTTTMLLGFAAILAGAVALILRLRPGTDPEDSHPDDGAQV